MTTINNFTQTKYLKDLHLPKEALELFRKSNINTTEFMETFGEKYSITPLPSGVNLGVVHAGDVNSVIVYDSNCGKVYLQMNERPRSNDYFKFNSRQEANLHKQMYIEVPRVTDKQFEEISKKGTVHRTDIGIISSSHGWCDRLNHVKVLELSKKDIEEISQNGLGLNEYSVAEIIKLIDDKKIVDGITLHSLMSFISMLDNSIIEKSFRDYDPVQNKPDTMIKNKMNREDWILLYDGFVCVYGNLKTGEIYAASHSSSVVIPIKNNMVQLINIDRPALGISEGKDIQAIEAAQGRREKGELPLISALRELEEEIGWKIEEDLYSFIMQTNDVDEINTFIKELRKTCTNFPVDKINKTEFRADTTLCTEEVAVLELCINQPLSQARPYQEIGEESIKKREYSLEELGDLIRNSKVFDKHAMIPVIMKKYFQKCDEVNKLLKNNKNKNGIIKIKTSHNLDISTLL